MTLAVVTTDKRLPFVAQVSGALLRKLDREPQFAEIDRLSALSDAELAASAREEEARKARAALSGQSTTVAPTPAGNDSAQPAPIDETPTPRATVETPRVPDTAPAPKPAATVASADSGARYILQAGAFGASGDAEATKAKIAMLGLSARVESAQINGKTVYRVRMGPYGTASELAEAKQKLASGGLPAMAVKAQ